MALVRALDRMIPSEEADLTASALGLLDNLQSRASSDPSTRSAFMRVVNALSLDMMAHAVGGFAALTEDEQNSSLKNIENTLPKEFSVVLGLVRDIYYEDERTPDRPSDFDSDSEVFGKVIVEDQADEDIKKRRKKRI